MPEQKKRQPADRKLIDTAKRTKKVLGQGLDALIPEFDAGTGPQGEDYLHCDMDVIVPNRFQPRQHFRTPELEELSRSIQTQGILQPLLVRKVAEGYELIAGERRLRAAKLAGLTQVPVVIKQISDAELLEISIVENIQRENLNPLEEAEAYHQLITEFNLTQDQAAGRVGKSRSAVANLLRLRQLSEPIKASIRDCQISMGHARALLGVEAPAQQTAIWQAIVTNGLSVRQTEALVKRLKTAQTKKTPPPSSANIYLDDIAAELSRDFGTRVQIKRQGHKGRLEIEFYNDTDLDRLLTLLKAR